MQKCYFSTRYIIYCKSDFFLVTSTYKRYEVFTALESDTTSLVQTYKQSGGKYPPNYIFKRLE